MEMSTEPMDIVQSEWASLDFVQCIHGLWPDFPLSPWIMSREFKDIVQGDSGNVH